MNLIQENGVNKYEWIGVVSFGVGKHVSRCTYF